MKKLLFLLLIVTSLCSFQCNDEENDPISPVLNIKGYYGNEPYITLKTYDYPDGNKINFTTTDFFIARIALIRDSGEEVVVNEIDLVDINDSHADATAAAKGFSLPLNEIQGGNFKGIRFGIGVPADLNAKKDTDYPSSHPLSSSSSYWTAWNSFIFSRTEGKLNPGPDSKSFTYHTGFDAQYRTVTLDHSFSLKKEGDVIPLQFNVLELFKTDSSYLDIAAHLTVHGTNDQPLAARLMDNYQAAFSWQ